VLNPDTNSDSLSVKSKGVRLVSAKMVTSHEVRMGIITIFVSKLVSFNLLLFNLLDRTIMVRINTAMEIS